MNSDSTAASSQRFHSWPASLALFAVATGGEFLALGWWYHYHAIGRPILASTGLWAGFLVERGVVVVWLHLPKRVITPAGNLRALWPLMAAVTVAEIIAWTLWIRLAEANLMALAVVVLIVGIHAVHSYEVALIKRRPFLPRLRELGVIVLTALEAGGGIWALKLATAGQIPGAARVMFGALFLEHIAQVSALKRGEQAAKPFHARSA